jgi:hypothetical protein
MLNWLPVVDYELREIEFERSECEFEKRKIAHEQRMKLLVRDLADRERERAAIRAQRQAECNLVQLRHQLEPSEPNAQQIRDVISLLEEYGGLV